MESKVRGQDLNALQTQIRDIETRFKGNRHLEYLVKMIRAIVGYLASRPDSIHGQIILVLGSLVDELAILVESPGISPRAADEVVARALESFKALKSGVAVKPLVSQRDIEELKSVILSIDWEISVLTLQSFDTLVNRLMTKVKSNKIHSTFLKMMLSIVGYVARNKENSHRGAIGLLRSVFQDYERMVRNPAMTVAEKKQLIKLDIQRFNKFNRQLNRSPGRIVAPDSDMEEMMPALSHVKSSPSSTHGMPLNELYDKGVSSYAHDLSEDQEITPALAGKKKGLTYSVDMMDDLFTAGGSESEDLLDAMHLDSMDGEDQGRRIGFFETPDGRKERSQEGVKHFTPQCGEQEPIPEIESCLDEFFNLDFTEAEIEPASQAPTSPDDRVNAEQYDQGYEPIVPFHYEDEIFEEDRGGLYAVNEERQRDKPFTEYQGKINRVPVLLHSLKTFLISPDGLNPQAGLTDFTRDILELEKEWQDDSDKLALLEMVTLLARRIHGAGKAGSTASGYDNAESPLVEPMAGKGADSSMEKQGGGFQAPAARGLWAKIRSVFRKS